MPTTKAVASQMLDYGTNLMLLNVALGAQVPGDLRGRRARPW